MSGAMTRKQSPGGRFRTLTLIVAWLGCLPAWGVDWPPFLARLDPTWQRLPQAWYEAPFLGNGMLGTLVRQIGPSEVRLDVCRGDVQDHRPEVGMFGTCRLPIGYFSIKTVGKLQSCDLRLDMWNAECRGTLVTDKGQIQLRLLVHADLMLILADIQAAAGESDCQLVFTPEPAVSPRYARMQTAKDAKLPENYALNPDPVLSADGNTQLCTQDLKSGGQTVTAWQLRPAGAQRTLFVSVAHTFPQNAARALALSEVRKGVATGWDTLVTSHRAWWHRFYPQSFVSIPDDYWEAFYWLQMYKLASATRADRMLIDNQGPWLQPTPWPGAWWNLNVQLTYWPTLAANRIELAQSLRRTLRAQRQQFIEAVSAEYRADSAAVARATGQDCAGAVGTPGTGAEVGNLPWACHNLYLQYRMTMDPTLLRDDLYPLLRRCINYYLHFLQGGADGKLHLPSTYSPEYGAAADCNFDLSLLRWGCGALLELTDTLHENDPRRPKWQEVLDKLTDYPKDAGGFMIGADQPVAKSHRHFSHLLMVYPLYLVNVEQPGAQEMIGKSLKHWHSFKGGLQGYSFTGGASISAALGRGDQALEYLNGLRRFLQPNTMYREAGPVIETPLSAAQSIHDLLLQSWGGTVRVFPAAPTAWQDIAFEDLRAQGAFAVSAARASGQTRWVRIRSLAGAPCRVRPGLPEPVRCQGAACKALGNGLYELTLAKNAQATLYSGATLPPPDMAPVTRPAENRNAFGLKTN
jgi:hypothetical protein